MYFLPNTHIYLFPTVIKRLKCACFTGKSFNSPSFHFIMTFSAHMINCILVDLQGLTMEQLVIKREVVEVVNR